MTIIPGPESPEPRSWATLLRPATPPPPAQPPPCPQYRLIELVDGAPRIEHFPAPDDASAAARALEVAGGQVVELWRGDILVNRWIGLVG